MVLTGIFTSLLALSGDAALARTTRIVQPEVRRAFYRTGGRLLVGRQVHLHVRSSVFRRVARSLPTRRSGELLVFDNRSVPLVVHSRDPYWRQASKVKEDAAEMCLKGKLEVPEWDPRRRVHLLVRRIKRAPGTWR